MELFQLNDILHLLIKYLGFSVRNVAKEDILIDHSLSEYKIGYHR